MSLLLLCVCVGGVVPDSLLLQLLTVPGALYPGRNNDKYPKYVRKLVAIQAFGDFCVLATKVRGKAPSWVRRGDPG